MTNKNFVAIDQTFKIGKKEYKVLGFSSDNGVEYWKIQSLKDNGVINHVRKTYLDEKLRENKELNKHLLID